MLTNEEFHLWCDRLRLSQEARAAVAKIRSSGPARRVGGGRNNVSGRYPSRKMGVTIQFESHRVELAFVYEMEHSPDVLEYYDQPPAIPLEYESAKGRRLAVMHTPDYFVIRSDSAGWHECKHDHELEKLANKSPNRYCRGDDGRWRCPPGATQSERFGFYYQLRSSTEIDWTLQRNIQYLEDYWRFDADEVAPAIRETVQAEVNATPGLLLSELFRRTRDTASRDDVHRLIATGNVFVDLRSAGVMEPDKARVFPNGDNAAAYRHIEGPSCRPQGSRFVDLAPGASIVWDGRGWSVVNLGERTVSLLGEDRAFTEIPLEIFENLVKDGRIVGAEPNCTMESATCGLLSTAGEEALRVANHRFDIVRRHLNKEPQPEDRSIPQRTIRLWVARYRRAQEQHGSGYLGLIPQTSQRGNRGSKLPEESRTLLHQFIEQNYETLTQKTKFTTWAMLLRACEENGIVAPSYVTFCLAVRRRPVFESVLKRKGRRAAYAHEPFYWQLDLTTPRHGDRPFEIGHIDHTELDVELVCSRTGRTLGRPWMTLLLDAFSRRCLAFDLSFDAPSYRSCMMILRACVRRHTRLPQILVIDGGPEFQGTYFETLLARYECIKKTRPPAKARFGSLVERVFGTTNKQFIHNLRGNTQITRNVRQMTKSVGPKQHATWTLAELHDRLSEYLFDVYDTIDHPALGQSPREAFQAGFEATGFRTERLIPYSQDFLMASLPATPKGSAKVAPGRGVKINHIYYWSSGFQDPGVENQQVPIRYDPFDIGTAYAFVQRQWVSCHSEYHTVFHGHSEKELMVASKELHRRRQHHSQSVTITARKLADFLRSVETNELLLTQRLRDQEVQAARNGLVAITDGPPSPEEFRAEEQSFIAEVAGSYESGEIYGEF
jgi:transposase InsO family protein